MHFDISRRSLVAGAALGVTMLSARATTAVPNEPPIFGPAPGIAQLSRNENPYGPAPSAIRAMADAATKGCYYTEVGIAKLTAMIAERFGVTPAHVVIGNGSTEVLRAAELSWGSEGAIACPDLFWDTTVKYAERRGTKLKRIPLKAEMALDLDGFAAAIGPDVSLVQICNPNNPTGMVLDGDAMRAFVRKVRPQATVLVDEAYNELTDRPDYSSVVELVKEGQNLIVCRTFSKLYGLAGLRVGYAITTPDKADRIRSCLMGFGVNSAGLAAAIASFNDEPFTRQSRSHIIEARQILLDAVTNAGLSALPSQANFLFVKVPNADAFQKAMATHDVVVRPAYGPWTQWSRVSTGRIEDVRRYAAALPQALAALPA